jgi:hypothetical protein
VRKGVGLALTGIGGIDQDAMGVIREGRPGLLQVQAHVRQFVEQCEPRIVQAVVAQGEEDRWDSLLALYLCQVDSGIRNSLDRGQDGGAGE